MGNAVSWEVPYLVGELIPYTFPSVLFARQKKRPVAGRSEVYGKWRWAFVMPYGWQWSHMHHISTTRYTFWNASIEFVTHTTKSLTSVGLSTAGSPADSGGSARKVKSVSLFFSDTEADTLAPRKTRHGKRGGTKGK